jgi:negative regulator of sigma E activity
MATEQYLFDVDEFKKGQLLYQVRMIKVDTPEDTGEIIATFKDISLCRMLRPMTIPEGFDFIITKYEVGNGIVDMIDFWDYRL